ncbi:hypothetical protein NPIL_185091 [Nephila pilipes]|uniref:Uncharacterized protein n=1 Tax=Nephila pilipes TaxID=299642 RepID=A0A8X6QD80_NEPPI|nr:hypothetical protein NPIL_185091 [Nephila pilipes]
MSLTRRKRIYGVLHLQQSERSLLAESRFAREACAMDCCGFRSKISTTVLLPYEIIRLDKSFCLLVGVRSLKDKAEAFVAGRACREERGTPPITRKGFSDFN